MKKYMIVIMPEYNSYEDIHCEEIEGETLEEAQANFKKHWQNTKQILASAKGWDSPKWYPEFSYLCEVKDCSPTEEEIETYKKTMRDLIEEKNRKRELKQLAKLQEKYKDVL